MVCRIGDPTDPNDLIRAGAHRATSILCTMGPMDRAEEEKTKDPNALDPLGAGETRV